MSHTSTQREKFGSHYYSTRNYRDYLTRKFDRLAAEIADFSGVRKADTILDFGCGYGGVVNAFWQAGYHHIWGTDISQWSIEYGQRMFPHLEKRLQFYNRDLLRSPNRLLLFLDVLEHMPEYEVESVLKLARKGAQGHVVVRIPVSAREGEPFILPVSNNDPTHICCHTSHWWVNTLYKADFRVSSAFSGTAIYDSPGVMAAIYE